MRRISFLSDSCLLAGGQPLARRLEHRTRGRRDADRIRSCLRYAHAEYARGSDPVAVAAGLLALLHETAPDAASGIGWLDAVGTRCRDDGLAAALAQHRLRGDEIVLVTELVQPRPATGVLGGLPVAIIGSRPPSDAMTAQRRVGAVAAHAAAAGCPLDRCHAYGQAVTDLPLLRAVGVPVVIGTHPTVRRAAVAGGWSILDGGIRAPVAAGRDRLELEE